VSNDSVSGAPGAGDPQRPESFAVDYHGQPFVFERLPDGRGYSYHWPLGPGHALHWIDTESGTRHKLSFDADGKASVVGSIAHEGGFHVVIEHGVMRDV